MSFADEFPSKSIGKRGAKHLYRTVALTDEDLVMVHRIQQLLGINRSAAVRLAVLAFVPTLAEMIRRG